MAGDPTKARLWANADVYVAFDLAAVVPADISAAFAATWQPVGLLNGEEGFGDEREEDTKDYYAWGGLLMRTSRKNFKLTRSFTAYEQNPVVNRLMWPGSTATALKVPKPEQVKIAFEVTDSGVTPAVKRRVISKNYAEITLDGGAPETEDDMWQATFSVSIFPDAAGVLWIPQPDVTLYAP